MSVEINRKDSICLEQYQLVSCHLNFASNSRISRRAWVGGEKKTTARALTVFLSRMDGKSHLKVADWEKWF